MKKLSFVLFLIVVVSGISFAQRKYALVIGNGDYTGISKLRYPVNDADSMATALQSLGFTVEKLINGNLDQMGKASENFRRKIAASKGSYGFFFFTGYGVQSGGDNFLIPVDAANIKGENDLRQRAVSVQNILDKIAGAGNELNIIVLDACRDNPFRWARSGNRGLSAVQAPAGSIVMCAAGPGTAADDGTGFNSLFTGQLLYNMKIPGLSVRDIFDKTGIDVQRVSRGKQNPELTVSYADASFAYLGQPPSPSPPPPAPVPKPGPSSADFEIKGTVLTGYKGSSLNVPIPEGVTTIWDSAFLSKNLMYVTLPKSVTIIGDSAFSSNKLTSVIIPDNVTAIGKNAFYDNKLVRVTIPDNVITIGDGAFSKNNLLNVTIGNNVTTIGDEAFKTNRLTSVIIPNNVTTIGDYVFSENTLTSVTIGSGVTTIGWGAFRENTLTSIIIPKSVTTIGWGAFAKNKLTTVTIPSSVTTIGTSAFGNCLNLTSIQVDPDNADFSSVDGVLFNKDRTILLQFPGGKRGAYSVPAGVTFIEESAFSYTQITSIIIPNSVFAIGQTAFWDNKLTSITIGSNVVIATAAFDNKGFPEAYEKNNRNAGIYTYSNNKWVYKPR